MLILKEFLEEYTEGRSCGSVIFFFNLKETPKEDHLQGWNTVRCSGLPLLFEFLPPLVLSSDYC